MNRVWRILVLLGGLTLVLGLVILCTGNSRDRSALQKYKAELRARHETLTFAELSAVWPMNGSRSPNRFLNAVGDLRQAPAQPGAFNLMSYVGPARARLVWKGTPPPGWQAFTGALAGLSGPLAELREELQDPPPDWGMTTNPFARSGPDFVAIRSAAQWLAGAAMAEVSHHNLEAALADLEASADLARMNRSEATLVAQMIRVAVATLGESATWEALQADGWSEPQLARLQRAWESLDLQDAIERGLVGERARTSQLWVMLRQPDGVQKLEAIMGRPTNPRPTARQCLENAAFDYIAVPIYRMTSIDADELFYLHTIQQSLDSVRRLQLHQPWIEAKRGLDQVFTQIGQAANSFARFRYWLSLMALPNFERAAENVVRAETQRCLTVSAIALKRYQLRHGTLPVNLDALVPDFLPALPVDPMSAVPLRYHLAGEGSFILYSVGEDGMDDGGNPTSSGPSLGLWAGRDAIWPSVAEPSYSPEKQGR